jgi:transposase
MANELKMATIQSILLLHAQGWSQQRIADALDLDRGTVSRYVRQAAQAAPPDSGQGSSKPANLPTGSSSKTPNLPTGSDDAAEPAVAAHLPTGSAGENHAPQPIVPSSNEAARASRRTGPASDCEPWREVILAKAEQGLSAVRIHQDLVSEHQATVGYDSVRRFLKHLVRSQELPFRRMECAPGEELQVDFGQGAPVVTPEGKRRRPHLFRAVLSHSRKGYTEVSWHQTTEDFIGLLENAFGHFGGVTKTVVIDNLKAAVQHPDWYDPELNPKLEAFCRHYGCVVLPTKPRTPRHKGKTERGVGYAQDNALKGRTFASLDEQNRHLEHWEATIADTRIHGTTKRQVGRQFLEVERPALQPLPRERFPFFHEAQRIVHRDGHIEVAKAYYSAPPEYLGRKVWVRWDGRIVRVFNHRMEQIALHVRQEPGCFSTLPEHIPSQKISGVERGAEWLLAKVRKIGPESTQWAEAMLENRGIEGLRVLQGLVSLAARHPSEAIERACHTAHSCRAFRLRILRELLKRQAPPQRAFEWAEDDPIIRPLSEYRDWLATALGRSASPALGFLRHGSGVREVPETEGGPEGNRPQGLGTSSTRPRSGYPSSGCSPAEPDSVSPDNTSILPFPFPPQEKSDE